VFDIGCLRRIAGVSKKEQLHNTAIRYMVDGSIECVAEDSWKIDEVFWTRRKNARVIVSHICCYMDVFMAKDAEVAHEKMAGQRKGRLREGLASTDKSCEKSPQ